MEEGFIKNKLVTFFEHLLVMKMGLRAAIIAS
jgi:hypothetical protein